MLLYLYCLMSSALTTSDCVIRDVHAGSIIVKVDLVIVSDSELTVDGITKQLLVAHEKDPGKFSVDTENIVAVIVKGLQCQTCFFYELASLPNGYHADFDLVHSGDSSCVKGSDLPLFGCTNILRSETEHRCAAIEYVHSAEFHGDVYERVFKRGCISVPSGLRSELHNQDATRYANEVVFKEKEILQVVFDYDFARIFLCDKDDCTTHFTPCADPHQVQCNSSTKCISLSQFCDQRDDCPGAEDEDVGFCIEPPPCSGPTDFKCNISETAECISKVNVCDTIFDCKGKEDEANCEGTCKRPKPPQNGKIIDAVPIYQDGGNISYGCNDGYTLLGRKQQCNNGTWDGTPPECISNCPMPNVNNKITIDYEGPLDNGARYPNNKVIVVDCKTGYIVHPMNDNRSFTCNQGDWKKSGLNDPNGFICKDVDECTEEPCDKQAKCANMLGSYECTCKRGYGGSGKACSDVNECDADPCAKNAACNNTEGSYNCKCIDGYEGDAFKECDKIQFLPYNDLEGYSYSLRRNYDYYARWYRNEYISYSLWAPSGFPFGKDFFLYIYLTQDGLVVFQDKYRWWKNSYPYPFGSDLSVYDPEAVMAPFWTKSDFIKGGNVFYQTYYSFWRWPRNYQKVFNEIDSRVATANNGTFADLGFNATWAAVITWENLPEVTSAKSTSNTNTFQAVLATDGLLSFAFFIYKRDGMNWQALEQKNVVIGYNNPGAKANPKNLHKNIKNKYRPDQDIGNTGFKGSWVFRLDDNDLDVVNPSKYCEEWANDQPWWANNLASWVSPCPCSSAQAAADGRYTKCERISLDLDGFNEPAEDIGQCFQQVWPRWIPSTGSWWWWSWWWYPDFTWYTAGARCSYNADGALITGYEDTWANSNAQLYHGALGGNYYVTYYATKADWRDKDVLARYYCCKKSDKCHIYEKYRPALTCDRYRQVQPGCFYGDPHIVTLDGGTYSFNGLGEYVMVWGDGLDYELQGRTGLTMTNGTVQETSGTVFIAFAAKMGITTVEFILNENRTEFITIVNGTELVNETMLKAEESYLSADDSSFTIDYTAATNTSGPRIAARWSTTLPEDNLTDIYFTVSAGVKFAMLDIVVELPPELKELNITRGLMGVYNGDDTDDFVFPNGSMLEPADGNLTEQEIFEYGETWRTTQASSLFSYYMQNSGNWSTNNNLTFVPVFLDDIISRYEKTSEGQAFLKEVYAICGEKKECLYDALVTNNTEIGANTKATDDMFQELVSNLDNFPPNITDIIEIGDTDSFQENRLLQLEVNQTYKYKVTANDSNDDDIMFSLPYDVLGATVTDDGLITLTPTSKEQVKLEVVVSDGKANSSLSFKVHICSCQNSGTCNWNSTSNDDNQVPVFAVASCICAAGWSGDDCSVDLDSCEEKPCFPGVQCQDKPPPSVNATCGHCPSGLIGNGFKCYDFNECTGGDTNDCDHNCTNILGSYICSCLVGFDLHPDSRTCDDIDECTLNIHDCDNNATCKNTVGSYECPCNIGYQNVDEVCHDTDECSTYPCANIAQCINYPGSYTCLCQDGYYGNGIICTDIDECRDADTNDCHEIATCKNSPGSYQCTCNAGWEGNGHSCGDVNECKQGIASCHSRADCTNTEGSYTCNCQAGFIGDGETCTDIDECQKLIDECVHNCANEVPGYRCACHDGFELAEDKMGCSVQEDRACINQTKTCGDFGQCLRINSTSTCICDRGAEVKADGTSCEDIDECTNKKHECDAVYGLCTNQAPGYICSCKTGYELDNDQRTCKDIDECSMANDCDVMALCNNTQGSYLCTCTVGYSGNGKNCANIDECITNPCTQNAVCTDTTGSYTCRCSDGYQGSGYDICQDIDECNGVDVCDAQATCINREGAYTCNCNKGYVGDGITCADIDECTSFNTPHDCPENSRCINNVGAFGCICKDGYTKSLVVNEIYTCNDVNECEKKYDDCNAIADCINTDGGFLCKCKEGYEGDGKTCIDINECAIDIPCSIVDKKKCKNRVGGYQCICQTNYFIQRADNICEVSISHSLVVLFKLVKGSDPFLYFDDVNTQDNRDALAVEIANLFNTSSIRNNFLGVLVENFASTQDGAQMTARMDFKAASDVENAVIKQVFLDGLSGNMFLGSDNQVVTVAVALAEINPCMEGTHDCFENNFQDCVFVADNQFDCENCMGGFKISIGGESCTEIKPCEEMPSICTDNKFLDCAADGPGLYHCENCTNGYDQEGDVCIVYKLLQGQFTMESIQGVQANYTKELGDSSSPAFIKLAVIICNQVTLALSDNTTILYNCEILEFKPGSIIVIYAIRLDNDASASPDDILNILKTEMITSGVIGVDNNSFILSDICDGVDCMNEGWCTADDNFDPICRCTSEYEGNLCQTATVVATTNDDLTKWQIVGIAIGCTVMVIFIVVMLVLVVLNVKSKAKVDAVNDDSHPENGMEDE